MNKKFTNLAGLALFLLPPPVAFADTELLTTTDGWTKITSISQDDIANNYYVIVDNDADLMLGLAKSTNQEYNAMFYQTSVADVYNDLSKVWIIEKGKTNYAIRNLGNDQLQLQTEWTSSSNDIRWRNNDQYSSIEWTDMSMSYVDGAWSLTSTKYSRPLGVYNNGTTVAEGSEIGANDTGKGAKFQIYAISREKFKETYTSKLSSATETSSRNATLLISNPTFVGGNTNGWTSSGTINVTAAAEFWHQTNFSFSQSLTNIPNGKYKVSAQVIENDDDFTCYLYATTSSGTQQANAKTKAGTKLTNWTDLESQAIYMGRDASFGKISVDVVVSDGKLTIGLADPNASTHWVVFDNFSLEYLGTVNLSEYTTAYENALVAAKAINQDSAMEKKVLEALKKAIEASVDKNSQESLTTATSALTNAANDANASIAAYAKAKAALDARAELLTKTNFYVADASFYTTPLAAYNAGTLTNAEANALENPANIINWHASTQINQFFGAAWGFKDYTGTPYVNTWSTEGNSDGSNFKVPFYEYWVNNNNKLADATHTGSISGLKANTTYTITASVRVELSKDEAAPAKGITMQVGDGEAVAITGVQIGSLQRYLDTYTAVGKTDADGKLTLKFNVASTNVSWLSFQHVWYAEVPTVALSEETTYTPEEDDKLANVTLTRTLTQNWNTIVLPFDLTAEQITKAFGEGVKVAEFSGAAVSGDNATLNFTSVSSTKANTPYMIRPAQADTTYTFDNVTLTKGDGLTASKGDIQFVGNYENGKGLTKGDYFIDASDNTFYRANGAETMKAFRATFHAGNASAAKFAISIDGSEPTAINAINAKAQQMDVYSIGGTLVRKGAKSLEGLAKGVYIVNGKSYIVK